MSTADDNVDTTAWDVIVLGGGAAGLFCAMAAGQRGKRVLVLEHTKRIGKKILMSGGGRCNFTNLNTTPDNFISANPHFCKSALARYTPWDFTALVEKHGIAYHHKTPGQLFCDGSSKQIVRMLADECGQAGVKIRTGAITRSVTRPDDFHVETTLGTFAAPKLVVATGGLSIPKMGASDFGHRLACQFGLPVTPLRAALVPFTLDPDALTAWSPLAGVALDVGASVPAARFAEPVLFTHRGLSGPGMLQASAYWAPGDSVALNLLPGVDAGEWLNTQRAARPKSALRTVLASVLSRRFVDVFCAQALEAGVDTQPIGQLSRAQLDAVAVQLEHLTFKPNGTEGYRTAEVTLGGVDTNALSSKTLEAKAVPGLHLIGEVVDVTGQLGGYNFQWAWASGWCAGQAV